MPTDDGYPACRTQLLIISRHHSTQYCHCLPGNSPSLHAFINTTIQCILPRRCRTKASPPLPSTPTHPSHGLIFSSDQIHCPAPPQSAPMSLAYLGTTDDNCLHLILGPFATLRTVLTITTAFIAYSISLPSLTSHLTIMHPQPLDEGIRCMHLDHSVSTQQTSYRRSPPPLTNTFHHHGLPPLRDPATQCLLW